MKIFYIIILIFGNDLYSMNVLNLHNEHIFIAVINLISIANTGGDIEIDDQVGKPRRITADS